MIRIKSWRRDPRAVAFRYYPNVENVIEVAMGEDDAAYGNVIPASSGQRAVETGDAAGKSRIDKVEGVPVTDDIEANRKVANL